MDITSYLLGKKSSGGGGADLSEYFNNQILNSENDTRGTTVSVGGWSSTIKKLVAIKPYKIEQYAIFAGFKGTEIDFTEFIKYYNETEDLQNLANLDYCFIGCTNLTTINLSGLNKTFKGFRNMFSGCINCTEINMQGINCTNGAPAQSMFYLDTALKKIDMRSFEFTNLGTSSSMFGSGIYGVPDNCLIIVKDQTQKDWINTNFSRLTNVQTVAEYEGN